MMPFSHLLPELREAVEAIGVETIFEKQSTVSACVVAFCRSHTTVEEVLGTDPDVVNELALFFHGISDAVLSQPVHTALKDNNSKEFVARMQDSDLNSPFFSEETKSKLRDDKSLRRLFVVLRRESKRFAQEEEICPGLVEQCRSLNHAIVVRESRKLTQDETEQFGTFLNAESDEEIRSITNFQFDVAEVEEFIYINGTEILSNNESPGVAESSSDDFTTIDLKTFCPSREYSSFLKSPSAMIGLWKRKKEDDHLLDHERHRQQRPIQRLIDFGKLQRERNPTYEVKCQDPVVDEDINVTTLNDISIGVIGLSVDFIYEAYRLDDGRKAITCRRPAATSDETDGHELLFSGDILGLISYLSNQVNEHNQHQEAILRLKVKGGLFFEMKFPSRDVSPTRLHARDFIQSEIILCEQEQKKENYIRLALFVGTALGNQTSIVSRIVNSLRNSTTPLAVSNSTLMDYIHYYTKREEIRMKLGSDEVHRSRSTIMECIEDKIGLLDIHPSVLYGLDLKAFSIGESEDNSSEDLKNMLKEDREDYWSFKLKMEHTNDPQILKEAKQLLWNVFTGNHSARKNRKTFLLTPFHFRYVRILVQKYASLTIIHKTVSSPNFDSVYRELSHLVPKSSSRKSGEGGSIHFGHEKQPASGKLILYSFEFSPSVAPLDIVRLIELGTHIQGARFFIIVSEHVPSLESAISLMKERPNEPPFMRDEQEKDGNDEHELDDSFFRRAIGENSMITMSLTTDNPHSLGSLFSSVATLYDEEFDGFKSLLQESPQMKNSINEIGMWLQRSIKIGNGRAENMCAFLLFDDSLYTKHVLMNIKDVDLVCVDCLDIGEHSRTTECTVYLKSHLISTTQKIEILENALERKEKVVFVEEFFHPKNHYVSVSDINATPHQIVEKTFSLQYEKGNLMEIFGSEEKVSTFRQAKIVYGSGIKVGRNEGYDMIEIGAACVARDIVTHDPEYTFNASFKNFVEENRVLQFCSLKIRWFCYLNYVEEKTGHSFEYAKNEENFPVRNILSRLTDGIDHLFERSKGEEGDNERITKYEIPDIQGECSSSHFVNQLLSGNQLNWQALRQDWSPFPYGLKVFLEMMEVSSSSMLIVLSTSLESISSMMNQITESAMSDGLRAKILVDIATCEHLCSVLPESKTRDWAMKYTSVMKWYLHNSGVFKTDECPLNEVDFSTITKLPGTRFNLSGEEELRLLLALDIGGDLFRRHNDIAEKLKTVSMDDVNGKHRSIQIGLSVLEFVYKLDSQPQHRKTILGEKVFTWVRSPDEFIESPDADSFRFSEASLEKIVSNSHSESRLKENLQLCKFLCRKSKEKFRETCFKSFRTMMMQKNNLALIIPLLEECPEFLAEGDDDNIAKLWNRLRSGEISGSLCKQVLQLLNVVCEKNDISIDLPFAMNDGRRFWTMIEKSTDFPFVEERSTDFVEDIESHFSNFVRGRSAIEYVLLSTAQEDVVVGLRSFLWLSNPHLSASPNIPVGKEKIFSAFYSKNGKFRKQCEANFNKLSSFALAFVAPSYINPVILNEIASRFSDVHCVEEVCENIAGGLNDREAEMSRIRYYTRSIDTNTSVHGPCPMIRNLKQIPAEYDFDVNSLELDISSGLSNESLYQNLKVLRRVISYAEIQRERSVAEITDLDELMRVTATLRYLIIWFHSANIAPLKEDFFKKWYPEPVDVDDVVALLQRIEVCQTTLSQESHSLDDENLPQMCQKWGLFVTEDREERQGQGSQINYIDVTMRKSSVGVSPFGKDNNDRNYTLNELLSFSIDGLRQAQCRDLHNKYALFKPKIIIEESFFSLVEWSLKKLREVKDAPEVFTAVASFLWNLLRMLKSAYKSGSQRSDPTIEHLKEFMKPCFNSKKVRELLSNSRMKTQFLRAVVSSNHSMPTSVFATAVDELLSANNYRGGFSKESAENKGSFGLSVSNLCSVDSNRLAKDVFYGEKCISQAPKEDINEEDDSRHSATDEMESIFVKVSHKDGGVSSSIDAYRGSMDKYSSLSDPVHEYSLESIKVVECKKLFKTTIRQVEKVESFIEMDILAGGECFLLLQNRDAVSSELNTFIPKHVTFETEDTLRQNSINLQNGPKILASFPSFGRCWKYIRESVQKGTCLITDTLLLFRGATRNDWNVRIPSFGYNLVNANVLPHITPHDSLLCVDIPEPFLKFLRLASNNEKFGKGRLIYGSSSSELDKARAECCGYTKLKQIYDNDELHKALDPVYDESHHENNHTEILGSLTEIVKPDDDPFLAPFPWEISILDPIVHKTHYSDHSGQKFAVMFRIPGEYEDRGKAAVKSWITDVLLCDIDYKFKCAVLYVVSGNRKGKAFRGILEKVEKENPTVVYALDHLVHCFPKIENCVRTNDLENLFCYLHRDNRRANVHELLMRRSERYSVFIVNDIYNDLISSGINPKIITLNNVTRPEQVYLQIFYCFDSMTTAVYVRGLRSAPDSFLKWCCEFTQRFPWRSIFFEHLDTSSNYPEIRDRCRYIETTAEEGRRVEFYEEQYTPLSSSPEAEDGDDRRGESAQVGDVHWRNEVKNLLSNDSSCVILLTSSPGAGKTYELQEIIDEWKAEQKIAEREDCSNDAFVTTGMKDVLDSRIPDSDQIALLVADEFHLISPAQKRDLFGWFTPRLSRLKVVLIGNRVLDIDEMLLKELEEVNKSTEVRNIRAVLTIDHIIDVCRGPGMDYDKLRSWFRLLRSLFGEETLSIRTAQDMCTCKEEGGCFTDNSLVSTLLQRVPTLGKSFAGLLVRAHLYENEGSGSKVQEGIHHIVKAADANGDLNNPTYPVFARMKSNIGYHPIVRLGKWIASLSDVNVDVFIQDMMTFEVVDQDPFPLIMNRSEKTPKNSQDFSKGRVVKGYSIDYNDLQLLYSLVAHKQSIDWKGVKDTWKSNYVTDVVGYSNLLKETTNPLQCLNAVSEENLMSLAERGIELNSTEIIKTVTEAFLDRNDDWKEHDFEKSERCDLRSYTLWKVRYTISSPENVGNWATLYQLTHLGSSEDTYKYVQIIDGSIHISRYGRMLLWASEYCGEFGRSEMNPDDSEGLLLDDLIDMSREIVSVIDDEEDFEEEASNMLVSLWTGQFCTLLMRRDLSEEHKTLPFRVLIEAQSPRSITNIENDMFSYCAASFIRLGKGKTKPEELVHLSNTLDVLSEMEMDIQRKLKATFICKGMSVFFKFLVIGMAKNSDPKQYHPLYKQTYVMMHTEMRALLSEIDVGERGYTSFEAVKHELVNEGKLRHMTFDNVFDVEYIDEEEEVESDFTDDEEEEVEYDFTDDEEEEVEYETDDEEEY